MRRIDAGIPHAISLARFGVGNRHDRMMFWGAGKISSFRGPLKVKPSNVQRSFFRALFYLLLIGCADISSSGPPVLPVEEEVRIGNLDEDFYFLTSVGDLAVTPDSQVLVLQQQERLIKVFDWDGRYLRQIGGPGSGPGEFVNPEAIGLMGDSLWVRDGGTNAIHFLDLSGRESRRVYFDLLLLDEGVGTIRGPSSPLSDGTFAGVSSPVNSAALVEGRYSTMNVLKLDSAGAVLGELIEVPYSRRGYGRVEGDNTVSYLSVGMRDSPLWAVSTESRRMALCLRAVDEGPTGYRIIQLNTAGDTLYSVFVPVNPVALAGPLKKTIVEETTSRSEISREFIEEFERIYNEFPYLPTASRMTLDQTGRVWVGREIDPEPAHDMGGL